MREATIQAVVPFLSLNSRVIQLDRAQPGGVNNPNAIPPFAPYRRAHVTSDLIRRGQARYAANFTQASMDRTAFRGGASGADGHLRP